MPIFSFLLVTLIVFAILISTKILGGNKGVDATIALAIGLLSLQFDYVANFFASIFPFAGIGLAVLLVAIIMLGLLVDEEKEVFNWILFGIGVLVFVSVLLTSLADFRWWGGLGMGWGESWPAILAGIVVLGLIFWVIYAGGGKEGKKKKERVN